MCFEKLESHSLRHSDDVFQAELYKGAGAVEQGPQVDPDGALLEHVFDCVQVRQEVTGGVDEEVRQDNVVVARVVFELCREITFYHEDFPLVNGDVGESQGAAHVLVCSMMGPAIDKGVKRLR